MCPSFNFPNKVKYDVSDWCYHTLNTQHLMNPQQNVQPDPPSFVPFHCIYSYFNLLLMANEADFPFTGVIHEVDVFQGQKVVTNASGPQTRPRGEGGRGLTGAGAALDEVLPQQLKPSRRPEAPKMSCEFV